MWLGVGRGWGGGMKRLSISRSVFKADFKSVRVQFCNPKCPDHLQKVLHCSAHASLESCWAVSALRALIHGTCKAARFGTLFQRLHKKHLLSIGLH